MPAFAAIDEARRQKAQQHLDCLTKPLGSLGQLEAVAAQYVAWREEEAPRIAGKAVYVFAADHGITDEGVSAYPREVTQQMVRNFLNGGAAINVLARQTHSDIVVVDVGVDADFDGVAGLVHRKVRRGTRNFAREAAMSEAELNAALQVGIDLAAEASAQGRTLIALGEMGIGNTSAATAITAALTGRPVAELTGRGTGVDDQRRVSKSQIIDKALRFHFGDFPSHQAGRARCPTLCGWPGNCGHRRHGSGRGGAAHRGRHRRLHLHRRSSSGLRDCARTLAAPSSPDIFRKSRAIAPCSITCNCARWCNWICGWAKAPARC